ncbi:MAG: hypothetical protein MI892_17475, partial [Desulfobacterales bacterium]|nr:hypothetical protein [Desulfobacterales bacterium]
AALVRAEKRASRSEEPEFHFKVERENDKTIFNVEGRLSGDWGGSELQAAEVISNSNTIEFRFHPDFSIDRAGVLKLTQFLQTVDEKGGHVRLTGLSFNYIRFFEMVGIHKMAQLIPGKDEEPGI